MKQGPAISHNMGWPRLRHTATKARTGHVDNHEVDAGPHELLRVLCRDVAVHRAVGDVLVDLVCAFVLRCADGASLREAYGEVFGVHVVGPCTHFRTSRHAHTVVVEIAR